MGSKRLQILDITVDIGGGKSDKITVYDNDEPSLVAREFSNRHNLSQKLEIALTRNIQDLVKELHFEKASLTKSLTASHEINTSMHKNVGQRLYLKGIQHKEQIEANKQILKMKLEKDLDRSASFQPVINKNSVQLAKNAKNRCSVESKQKSVTSSDTEYTFSPRINEKSLRIAGTSSNRIDKLYEEAELKKNRLQSMYENACKNEFPFKPVINYTGESSDPQELVERLLMSKANYEENLQRLKKKYEVNRDPVTGQEFFKPVTCNSSTLISYSSRNREDVWSQLYNHPKKAVEPSQDFPYSPVRLDSKAASEKYLMKVKIERFSELFQKLNPDSNGLIRYQNIVPSAIEPEVMKIILPLLLELQELNQPLNLEEFVESMENLLKTLSTAEKALFMTKPKKKPFDEVPYKSVSQSCDFAGLYKRHLEKQGITAAKLEIEREKQKKLEVKGCTFKPKLTKFRLSLFK